MATSNEAGKPVRIRKRFKLGSRSRKATQLNIYSKGEFYSGKPASERLFDEFIEEEEDDMDLFLGGE